MTTPLFISKPMGYPVMCQSSTSAQDWVVPDTKAVRLDNAGICNSSATSVVASVVDYDISGAIGTTVWNGTIEAGSYVNLLETMFGKTSAKYYIVNVGRKLRLQVDTAVDAVSGVANGGEIGE